jgi:hypothetical protein
MKYTLGDMWDLAYRSNGFVVVTTNCCVRSDGKAVMGAGVAKDAAVRFPYLPSRLGKHINQLGQQVFIDNRIICLPTKTDWKLPSSLELIERGCIQLAMFGRLLESVGATHEIFIPKLGCGLGGLDWEKQVRPVVDSILEGDRFILVSV